MVELATVMLQNGVNPNQEVTGHDSPLIQAIRRQSPKIVEALLKAKANVNYQGEDMYTALHVWCENIKQMDNCKHIIILELVLYDLYTIYHFFFMMYVEVFHCGNWMYY